MDFPCYNISIGTSELIKPFMSIIKDKKIFKSITRYSDF